MPSMLRRASMKRSSLGVLVVVVAVIWQGVGTAVVGTSVDPTASLYVTFTAFGSAALISVAARFLVRGPGTAARPPRMSRGDFWMLNLVTAGAFGTFYIAATLVPPTAASVTEFSIAPLVVALASRMRRRLVQPGVVLLIAATMVVLILTGTARTPAAIVSGLGLATVAGACAAGVLLTSSHLTRHGFRARHIAANRFHLVWLVTGAMALPAVLRGNLQEPGHLALVGVLCIGLPILLLQWGITLCPPLPAALLLTMVPAVVWFTESAMTGRWSSWLALTMAALVLAAITGTVSTSVSKGIRRGRRRQPAH
ncbi:hypothetical protein [Georgenia alba]|uniref:EamA family transporter n=1 Tax=Georgenia alba TaxID=2233858 RepID=A0ABW2Q2Z0_9MICO